MPESVANGASVLGLFDQAARAHPGATAVEAADRTGPDPRVMAR